MVKYYQDGNIEGFLIPPKIYNRLVKTLTESIEHFKDYDDETEVIPEFVQKWKKSMGELIQ